MMNRLLSASGRSVPNLVISQRVIDKMSSAARHFIEDETGEAMVGLLVPGANTNGVPTLYVLDTIAPDESAVRQLHTFQQGDERQDELIWWLQENWQAYRHVRQGKDGQTFSAKWDVPLRYLGDWHKQPGFMIQPSMGDLMTARGWIEDQSNSMDFLLAPIVTLGHPATTPSNSANTNFLTVPQGDGTCMRVDFWYIDLNSRDFLPIAPTMYPSDQLPALADYPWHLMNTPRFNAEYDLLEKDGLFTSLILWDANGEPPLEVCFLTARMGSNKILLLITPWNYPAAPPTARVAPFIQIEPDEDIYSVFEELWGQSVAVENPPGWTWAEGRHLIDYVYALEEALGIEKAPAPTPPAEAIKPDESGEVEKVEVTTAPDDEDETEEQS